MKNTVLILSFLVCICFAGFKAAASTTPARVPDRVSNSGLNLRPQFVQITPATASGPDARHLFPVNDAKGLLLTCVAPEIGANPNTDVFKDCTLAPGRTLDDVMHTFIGAIHYIQSEATKNSAGR